MNIRKKVLKKVLENKKLKKVTFLFLYLQNFRVFET